MVMTIQIQDEDLALVQECAAKVGGKFNADHFRNPNATEARRRLIQIAYAYAVAYEGKFDWMQQTSKLARNGVLLSVREVAGVLNCVLNELEQERRKALYEQTKAETAPAPQGISLATWSKLNAKSKSYVAPGAPMATRSFEEIFGGADELVGATDHNPVIETIDLTGDLPEVVTRPVEPDVPLFSRVPSGTYTIVFDGGEYITLRLEDADEFAREKFRLPEGAQFIAYLNGPDNSRNYQTMGTFSPPSKLTIWSKHRHLTDKVAAIQALLTADRDSRKAMGVAYARQSGNCYICRRKLTTPTSIAAGIGPICAERV